MRTTDPKFELLRSLDVLADLPGRRVAELVSMVDEVDLEPGEVLIHQGQLNRHAYLVASGLVAVDVGDQRVATVGAGSIVGERSAVNRGLANATVTVVEPTRVLAIEHRALLGAAVRTEAFGEQLQLLADERTNRAA